MGFIGIKLALRSQHLMGSNGITWWDLIFRYHSMGFNENSWFFFMREFHLPSGEMNLFWQNGDLPDKNGDIMRYKMGCYWKNQTWQWENGWTKSRFLNGKIIVQRVFQLPVANSLSKLCVECQRCRLTMERYASILWENHDRMDGKLDKT